MGCEGYSSDFLADTVSVGMPASFPQDAYINVVSCLGSKGFENKEAGRIGSFEHLSELTGIDKFIKDENGVGMEEVQLKFLEEQDDFPKLSPLRDDRKGTFSCDGSRGSMDLISTVSRNDSVCENSYLASSRLSVGGRLEEDSTLMEVDENLVNKMGEFNCLHLSNDPVVASGVSNGVWMEGKNASLLGVQSHMPNFESNVENVTFMVERRKENDQKNGRRMPFHYVRKHKEADKFNTLAALDGIGICEQEVADEEKFRIPEVDFESCNRVQSRNKSAYCSSLQKNLSVKPSHSSTSFACYSGSIADPEIGASTSHAFKRSSIYCSKDDHYHGEADKFAGVIAKTSKTTVVRRANPKRAASLKSSLIDETSNQLIRIKTDGRKCQGKVSTRISHTSTVIGIFGEVKRKKRSSYRCPRHSIWGASEKLFGIIMQKNVHVKHGPKQNDTLKRRPRNPRPGASGTNKNAILKSRGSQFSITRRPPSTMSAQPLFVDAKIQLEDNINHSVPTSNGHFSAGTSYKKVEFEQNMAERCGSVFKSNTRERQLGEKDLESTLTQETSADNFLSECHGVSSRIDVEFASATVPCKKSFDSGNSPDSDVYNPHVDFDACTLDGFASIKLEGVMDQNTLIQEKRVEYNLPSAALNFNKPFIDPVSALAKRTKMRQDSSKAKSKKGQQRKKKNEKRQKKENREKKLRNAIRFNFPSASSSHPSIAKKLEVLGKLEKEQRTSLSSVCIINDEEAPGDGGGKPKSGKKHSKKGFKSDLSLVNSSVLGLTNLDFFDHSFGAHSNTETRTNPLQNDSDGLLESILPIDDIQSCGGHQSVKTRVSKRTLSLACSLRRTRKLRCGQQKRNIQKSEKVLGIDAYPSENGLTCHPSGANDYLSSQGGQIHGEAAMPDALLKDASNDVTISVLTKLSARERYNILLGQFPLSGKKAWALCDECQKWRCVPDELVSIIEKSKWTCQDNVDEAFADCAVPQEKTDEAINRDLGILEEEDFSMAQNSCGEIALRRQSAAARPAWTLIKSNIFLHRSRRTQTIDEIMVCQCNIRPSGGVGCGEECLNRMLNIECVRGTCPCGDLCSNQQFQRRRYAKFKWIKCGKKGYGLQLEEDVLKGQFLIEYVGEVLDLAAYEARLKNYACRGQKHFYFMTLNGGEVIDACDKGNLGRFINHSCDPNCRTEKWMVNGEVCIGLFAIRDIKKGEEVTFDYNYVRVFGAAAKRCICGSADCRGYIGGDPSNSEVIVQDDSDGEDFEPLMVDEAVENEFGVVEANSEAIEAKAVRRENVSVDGNDSQVNPVISDAMHCPSSKLNLNEQSAVLMEPMGSICRVSEHQPLQDTQIALAKVEPDLAAGEPLDVDTMPSISRCSSHGELCERSRHSMDTLHADQVVQTSISADLTKFPSKASDAVTSKKKLTTSTDEENSTSKSNIAMKSLHPVKVKRSLATIRTVASVKAKKVSNTICNRHIEGVEEKLNELLDDDGGIRRQKDAAKGYLKLLVVTSAAGDEISGSVSQSARDLSLILDAILKTKSRMVLVDIINKNGLQMLHKMLKQNNDNFNRIPILRKLLKVLEFLAEKQILSRDLINAAAPCSRMESFKESMLKLMKHRDSQIQVSARNFSNQWIPRTIRTMRPSDRDDPQMSIKRRGATKFKSCHEQGKWESDAIVCVNATNSFSTSPSEVDNLGVGEAFAIPSQLMSCSASFADGHTEGTRVRKRKSRWDQPAEVDLGFSQASQCSGDQLVLDSVKKPCLQLGTISSADVPRQTSNAWSERNNSSRETTTESIQHDVEDGEMPPGFESPCMDEHCINSSVMGETVIAHPQERYLPHLPVSYGMPLLLMQQLGTPETEGSNGFGPSLGIAPAFPFKPFPPLPTYPRKDTNGACGENSTINACAVRPQVKEKVQQEKICTPSNERALCHSNGNGRRFSQWPRHWNNQRYQRCPPHWLQGVSAFRFEGGSRNRVRNLDSGNSRMDGGGGFNPSQGVNSAYFRSKFNRKDCYHN